MFLPSDFWMGLRWDRSTNRLLILLLPCCGMVVQFADSGPTADQPTEKPAPESEAQQRSKKQKDQQKRLARKHKAKPQDRPT
jgi:hypothetical protein